MEHIVIDLETLGKRAGCRVLSVALCRASDEAHVQVNLQIDAQVGAGMLPDDPETVQWWREQPIEVWNASVVNPIELRAGLEYLGNWIKGAGGSDYCVWGYGAGFDLPVLKHLYATFGVALPWAHWQEMCARTVRTLSGVDPEQFRVLPKHNPTNDVLTEVRWLKSGMATLFGRMAG